jgi:hypothetical protein
MPSGTWKAYLVWKIKENEAQIARHVYRSTGFILFYADMLTDFEAHVLCVYPLGEDLSLD